MSRLNPGKGLGPNGIPTWILPEYVNLLSKPMCAICNSNLRESFLPSSVQVFPFRSAIRREQSKGPEADIPDPSPRQGTGIFRLAVGYGPSTWQAGYLPIQGAEQLYCPCFSGPYSRLGNWHGSPWRCGEDSPAGLQEGVWSYWPSSTHWPAGFPEPSWLPACMDCSLPTGSSSTSQGRGASSWLAAWEWRCPWGHSCGAAGVLIYGERPAGRGKDKFVKDTLTWEVCRQPVEVNSTLQHRADEVVAWTNVNRMQLKVSKTKMLISFTRQTTVVPSVLMNANLLGVIISSDHSWSEHVDFIASKGSQII